MSWNKTLAILAIAAFCLPAAAQQNVKSSCVAVRPGHPNEVWTCNRDNNSVSVVDVSLGTTVAEVPTGNWPRSVAFSVDGSKAFVAGQRGNVAFNKTFVTPFDGSEIRGTITVIDAASRGVLATLDNAGIEPYGLAVAPNGMYFTVTGFRSGTVKCFNVATLAEVASFQYLSNLNLIPPPFTIADADANRDGIADLGEPRGFVIFADSRRILVTHHRSSFVSALDVALDANGMPTGITLAKKIDTNVYPFDPIYNPTPVQTIASQGLPRFLEDVAVSPDGTRALVPHVLHNINHDVNFDFGPSLAGAFANRVYPALTMIDTVAGSFGVPGDLSNRLHNQLSDPQQPAEFVPYGTPTPNRGGVAMLGATGEPLIGGSVTFVIDGLQAGQNAQVWIGRAIDVPMGPMGTQLVKKRYALPVPAGSDHVTFPIANSASLNGVEICCQAVFFNSQGRIERFSNGVKMYPGYQGVGANKMGYRAGQPDRKSVV